MAETLHPPIVFEVGPLFGQEREDAIAETQALLAEQKFNPIYFSRVIGNVASLVGGTRDERGSRIVSTPVPDTQRDKAFVIWKYPMLTNSLWIEPSWTLLPPTEQSAARGHEPYTREHTSILYRNLRSRYDAETNRFVDPSPEETSVLELSSRLWFPIGPIDRSNCIGGFHWSNHDGDVDNGWASREKSYTVGSETQRALAQSVFDAWQSSDPISNGQKELPFR